MTESELLSICQDIPHPKGPGWSTRLYGMGDWLKRYAGYPTDLIAYIEMNHGPHPRATPAPQALKAKGHYHCVHGSSNYQAWVEESNKPCIITGSPFAHHRYLNKIQPSSHARGTLAFPAHSTHHIEPQINWTNYLAELQALPEEYHPISICLYWADIHKGLHKMFMDAGVEVISFGHMYDPLFMQRFYQEVKRFKYVTSPHCSSAGMYAYELGLTFFTYGKTDYQVINSGGDGNNPTGKFALYGDILFYRITQITFWELAQKGYQTDEVEGLKTLLNRKFLKRNEFQSALHSLNLPPQIIQDVLIFASHKMNREEGNRLFKGPLLVNDEYQKNYMKLELGVEDHASPYIIREAFYDAFFAEHLGQAPQQNLASQNEESQEPECPICGQRHFVKPNPNSSNKYHCFHCRFDFQDGRHPNHPDNIFQSMSVLSDATNELIVPCSDEYNYTAQSLRILFQQGSQIPFKIKRIYPHNATSLKVEIDRQENIQDLVCLPHPFSAIQHIAGRVPADVIARALYEVAINEVKLETQLEAMQLIHPINHALFQSLFENAAQTFGKNALQAVWSLYFDDLKEDVKEDTTQEGHHSSREMHQSMNQTVKQEELGPIIVGGLRRSGTSLIRATLGSHSQVAFFQNDLQFWHQFYKHSRGKFEFTHPEVLARELLDRLYNNYKVAHLLNTPDRSQVMARFQKIMYSLDNYEIFCGKLWEIFIDEYRQLMERPRWALKTPENEFYADQIFQTHPNAKFIHVIRDPYQVMSSMKKAEWLSEGEYGFAEQMTKWNLSVDRLAENQHKWPQQYFGITYNNFVKHSEKYLKILMAFTGLEEEQAVYDMTGHIGWQGNNSSFKVKEKGISKDLANKKINNLTDRDLELIDMYIKVGQFHLWERFKGYTLSRIEAVNLVQMAQNIILHDKGNTSVIALDLALEIDPTYTEAHYHKACLLSQKGLIPDALKLLLEVVKTNPLHRPALLKLKELGQVAGIESTIEELLKVYRTHNPNDHEI